MIDYPECRECQRLRDVMRAMIAAMRQIHLKENTRWKGMNHSSGSIDERRSVVLMDAFILMRDAVDLVLKSNGLPTSESIKHDDVYRV